MKAVSSAAATLQSAAPARAHVWPEPSGATAVEMSYVATVTSASPPLRMKLTSPALSVDAFVFSVPEPK